MDRRLLCIAPLILLSTGCATNVIRLERASAMGDAGRAAAAGTRALLQEVGAANREKLIAVAALDPVCRLPTPTLAAASRTDVRVCVPPGAAVRRGDLVMRRFDARAFGPSIAVVEALAAYLGAADAIVTAKPIDVGAELDGALAKLRGAVGDVATITGAESPPLLKTEQQAALVGAVAFVSAIAAEADRVETLRLLETPARDEQFRRIADGLRRVNDGLADVLGQELEQQLKVLELTRSSTAAPRADRREEMALIERAEDVSALRPALSKALDALELSRADYVALLRDAGAPLTAEERATRARIAQDRVLSALGVLATLVRAF